MITMYLAKPDASDGPGVLVLHSWWGLNGFFRDVCDRLAAEGFVALGVDLYDGRVATTIPEAKALRAEVGASRREPAYRSLMRMIGDLRSEAPGHIALLGFSMGGHWAYWLSQRPELGVTKTVTFYAARDGDYATSRSAFLAHFAETDDWVSSAGIRKLDRSLTGAGREHTFHTYEGTGHWFFEADRPEYDPDAAALAWKRTLAFLHGSG
jgi:carboxymethylenebutenolidase